MQVLRFIPTKPYKVEEVEITGWEIVEGLYVRTPKGLSPAAYHFPLEAKEMLEEVAEKFKAAEKAMEIAQLTLMQLRWRPWSV